MKSVIVTCDLSTEAFQWLKAELSDYEVKHVPQPSNDDLKHCTALIIRSSTRISPEFLPKAPELKLIVTVTSGFDHIDLKATGERNIVMMYTPNSNADSAAELTWALLLATTRQVCQNHTQVKAGLWRENLLRGQELKGKTLGIVGVGRIGSRVAKIGLAFGMRVMGFDPFIERHQSEIELCGYDELLRQVDFLSYHVPYTKQTHHMLNSRTIEEMADDVTVINTSRGLVIAEQDLMSALQSGKIKAAGLDVFEREPLKKESSLRKLPQVVFSPHAGAYTQEAFMNGSMEAAQKVVDYLCHNKWSDTLPPKAAWFDSPLF